MNPHVLVVDDSLIVRMDLRGALTAAGFDVTVCDTKRAAEGLLDQRSFSALVLDVMLPDGDGVEILRGVRAAARHAGMPIIMLSAEAEIRDRVRGLSMGADEYVGKPYNIAYFIGRIRELCHSRRGSGLLAMSSIGCRRILVVDDSATYRQYIAQMLREDGHDVVLAQSGIEALDMLAAQTIDCVVLDMHMPNIGGLETLRKIRQTPGRESTPILMLTDSDKLTLEREALDAGADAFLRKSSTFEVIHFKMRQVLRGRRTALEQHETTRSLPTSYRASSSKGMASSTGANQLQSKDLNPLFVEAASAMGLNTQLARSTLTKALGRMRIDPQRMDCTDLARTIPALRDALQMFFSPDELAPRIEALASLATRTRGRIR